MAFTSVANSPARFSVDPIYEAGIWRAIAHIGFDPDGPSGAVTYYIFVHFYPCEESIEYAFGLVWSNNETREREQTYESLKANSIVPAEHRKDVFRMIEFYTFVILKKFEILEFFMETYDKNLPDKALVKYNRLSDMFTYLGYEVTPGQPGEPGKRRWLVSKRLPEGHSPSVSETK
jgi:hypothetical protein